jgi:hypothetical protein
MIFMQVNFTNNLIYAEVLDIYGLNFVPAEYEEYQGGTDVALNSIHNTVG